ncbi:MAG TPA: hypothetical protein EYO51_07920 [Methylococcaceae bacterium]|jgi:prenyltransferase beta subunit|nr:hypothetical protein [Methylococcaceae bacterium]HIN68111.1 hypothetical protein [Methylococcales bacterium]HIA45411.1 hypothetical protein [Methylococcaceae bacterium]HIB63045.1 hypothetical protein [Methylococcaceae bacterium]HIO13344.1 hypothetical protein [Methylococcales bacterium]
MNQKNCKEPHPPSTGVKETPVAVQIKSPRNRSQIHQKTKSTPSTHETVSGTIKEVFSKTVFLNLEAHLEHMESTAQLVLEKANIPTDNSVATNDGYTIPKEIAKSQFGEHSDEYYAGSVLFFCSHIRNAVTKGNSEAAALFSLQAITYYQELLIDPYAYAIGVKILSEKKNQDWITRAIAIMKKEGYTEKQLINHSRTVTFSKLALLVVEDQTQSGLKADNEELVRQALISYFKS